MIGRVTGLCISMYKILPGYHENIVVFSHMYVCYHAWFISSPSHMALCYVSDLGSKYVAQADFKLLILLPQSLKPMRLQVCTQLVTSL